MAVWINLMKIRYFISRFVYLMSVVKETNVTPFRLRSVNLCLTNQNIAFEIVGVIVGRFQRSKPASIKTLGVHSLCTMYYFCVFSFKVKEVYGNG